MPKIRYAELPAGLHVSAKPHGRDMIIFLQPGLNAAQRRAALARVRSIGRMGYGPPVSALGMAMAVSADKVRTTMRNGVAAMRGHPVLLLPPMFLLVSTIMVVVPMSFLTGTVRQHERTIADFSGLMVAPGHPGRSPAGLAPSPRTGQSPAPPAQPAPRVPVPMRPSPRPAVSPPPQPSPAPGGVRARQVRPGRPGSPRPGPDLPRI